MCISFLFQSHRSLLAFLSRLSCLYIILCSILFCLSPLFYTWSSIASAIPVHTVLPWIFQYVITILSILPQSQRYGIMSTSGFYKNAIPSAISLVIACPSSCMFVCYSVCLSGQSDVCSCFSVAVLQSLLPAHMPVSLLLSILPMSACRLTCLAV